MRRLLLKALRIGLPVVFMVGVLLLLFPSLVSATPAQADALDIPQVTAFRHLLETDDMLVVLHYEIEYASPPAEPANELYLFRLMNGSTELGIVLPYTYQNLGYGEGAAAFYFAAADAPTWGQDYQAVLQGNPTVYSNAETWKYTFNMSSAHWTSGDADANEDALRLCILDIAESLEIDWSETLLVSGRLGYTLNATGGDYFEGVIPGLPQMNPYIFSEWDVSPSFPAASFSRTEDVEVRSTTEGTEGIGDLVAVIERNLGIPYIAAGALISFALYLFVIFWMYSRKQQAEAGILVGLPVMILAVRLGLLPMAAVAIMALLSIMAFGYVFFFRNA